MEKIIKLTTDFIKLDSLLKLARVASSGGQAKTLIQGNWVSLNGTPTTQRGRKIRPGDIVEVSGDSPARIVVQ